MAVALPPRGTNERADLSIWNDTLYLSFAGIVELETELGTKLEHTRITSVRDLAECIAAIQNCAEGAILWSIAGIEAARLGMVEGWRI
jgi:hypothetical protein